MIRRVLDVFRQGMVDQAPRHPLRPNELSREVVRAERLRREAHQAEAAARRTTVPSDEERTRRERAAPMSAPPVRRAPRAASRLSRSELRRAMLLKEIIGPPAALRWPRGGEPEL